MRLLRSTKWPYVCDVLACTLTGKNRLHHQPQRFPKFPTLRHSWHMYSPSSQGLADAVWMPKTAGRNSEMPGGHLGQMPHADAVADKLDVIVALFGAIERQVAAFADPGRADQFGTG
jgi:hypothetical protein